MRERERESEREGAFYLMSSCSEAQPELSTDHSGLVDAPVFTADGAPSLRPPEVHQHLDAAL